MVDSGYFEDDPDHVRERLAAGECESIVHGNWYVFETISADGTLAIGVTEGEPDRGTVMIVYENLSQRIAMLAAQGLSDWYRRNGRNVGEDTLFR